MLEWSEPQLGEEKYTKKIDTPSKPESQFMGNLWYNAQQNESNVYTNGQKFEPQIFVCSLVINLKKIFCISLTGFKYL